MVWPFRCAGRAADDTGGIRPAQAGHRRGCRAAARRRSFRYCA